MGRIAEGHVAKLAIVGYPILSDVDREWIESLRASHDPQAALIRAHFTIVFPTELSATLLVAHAAMTLAASKPKPIPFALGRAEAVANAVGTGSHVFLVATRGRRALVALHDRLYEAALRPHLRSGIAFIPHITVGAAGSLEACEHLAEGVNKEHHLVRGLLGELHVIEVGADDVRSLAVFPLGNARSPSSPTQVRQ